MEPKTTATTATTPTNSREMQELTRKNEKFIKTCSEQEAALDKIMKLRKNKESFY